MQITIDTGGLDRLRARIGGLAKQVDYAASRALNTSAFAVQSEIKKDMAATFKGGATAYTLRAFEVKKATKATLTATIALRQDAPGGNGTAYTKALAHLFTGGRRSFKKLEGWLRARRLLPNGLTIAPGAAMPLDRFGNMRQAALTEMLGVLGAQRPNLRVYRRSGRGQQQKAVGYFVIQGGTASNLHPGIYKRFETGTTSTIRPMVLYVNPISYRKFVDLERLGRSVVQRTFQPAFDAELTKALASAR